MKVLRLFAFTSASMDTSTTTSRPVYVYIYSSCTYTSAFRIESRFWRLSAASSPGRSVECMPGGWASGRLSGIVGVPPDRRFHISHLIGAFNRGNRNTDFPLYRLICVADYACTHAQMLFFDVRVHMFMSTATYAPDFRIKTRLRHETRV